MKEGGVHDVLQGVCACVCQHSQVPRQVGVGSVVCGAVPAVVSSVQDECVQLWPVSGHVGSDDVTVSGRHFWCFVHKQVVAGVHRNQTL